MKFTIRESVKAKIMEPASPIVGISLLYFHYKQGIVFVLWQSSDKKFLIFRVLFPLGSVAIFFEILFERRSATDQSCEAKQIVLWFIL